MTEKDILDIAQKINCNDVIDLPLLLESFEKTLLRKSFLLHNSLSETARFLKLSKTQVLNRIKKYNIQKSV